MYIVFVQDEYNNDWLMGVFKRLEEAVPEINSFLENYGTEIDELKEYPSTFGSCFDKEIETPNGEYLMIRGFYIEGISYEHRV